MTTPTIFETCRPRDDVLSGAVADVNFTADAATVIAGRGSIQYRDPARLLADTYPTRGSGASSKKVCQRRSRAGRWIAAIFRLGTAYRGGKTHGHIACMHFARGSPGCPGSRTSWMDTASRNPGTPSRLRWRVRFRTMKPVRTRHPLQVRIGRS